ncbi:anhydro-N-acetylmuramic acid kinase [Gaetbulibacter sp. M240]|uniref:anhydro-N-acetylmuramic acid kinase n=1 Tax=Gaetbulibacter sp. M240 TaxID=3126511 RepID=UPI00374EB612
MKKNLFRVIGVMSGTSLDGIDLVLVEFEYQGVWRYNIKHSETVKYPDTWYQILKDLVKFSDDQLQVIDTDYTTFLTEVIQGFINKFQIKDFDAICSHGHTAKHEPDKGYTYQIGNLPILAKKLGQAVVCDFRVQDVALGGQGAPLVPIGDKLLFSDFDFCLNLGGFANVSFSRDGERVAYDICPVNIVLNHYAKQLGFDYDDGGSIASNASLDEPLLRALNGLNFYKQTFPKSLGIEWVHSEIFPLINEKDISTEVVLRTLTEHISDQIGLAIKMKPEASVLITGGGAYNTFLIQRIKEKTLNRLHIPDRTLIEFKEAIIFGFLGVLKLRNEVNCLKSVTGASKNHSSGKIFTP